MRVFFGRLRRAFPLRVGALILLAFALTLVFIWSPEEADFLVYPAGLVALGLVVICASLVTLGTVRLKRIVSHLEAGVPETLETTQAATTRFRVPALRGFLVLEVSLAWVKPTSVEVRLEAIDGELVEIVTPNERGRFTKLTRRFTVEDVFGLSRISFDQSWDAPLRITPLAATHSAQLAAGYSQGETLANPAGRVEGDLVEMRAYAHGDSMRHVLWKAYARTRRLLVRMPERALAPGPVSVAFLVAGPDDEASAGAARLYIEAGLLGADLMFCADGATAPARTPRDALEQIVDSHAHRENGGATLETVAAQIDPARLTSCLVFAPPIDGPWRERLVGFVRRHSLDATIIIGIDEAVEPMPAPARVQSLFFETEETTTRPSLVTLRSALAADGLNVKVLHCKSGQLV